MSAAAAGWPLAATRRTVPQRPSGGLVEVLRAAADEPTPVERARIAAGTAFYRKYTEQVLVRYEATSMAIGRTPSVLGNLIFRGRSSHSVIRNFEDAIIFVHDIESCLKRLDRGSRELLGKIALMRYTQAEVAEAMGVSTRSVMRRYFFALDRLTEILLDVELLEVRQCPRMP